MIIVSGTTPLIGLAAISRFDLLRQMFAEVHIPQAVYDEIVIAGREKGVASREVETSPWINVVAVKDQLAVEVLLDELDAGEAETIVLARELGADWVLMDERKGRRKLDQLGLPKIGTLGGTIEGQGIGTVTNDSFRCGRFASPWLQPESGSHRCGCTTGQRIGR